ncbi:MAG: elongation factor P 5-aminopentanone reductase [Lachnospira sp.]
MNNNKNKTIIVTGASRGIGRAIALSLAVPGNSLVISCLHSKEMLSEVYEIITSRGAQCEMFIGDMGNYSDVEKMFSLAVRSFGKIDILINNSGVSSIGLFQDMAEQEWDRIISANLKSVYNCSHFAVEDMIKRHSGIIINISSVWGVCGASCEVAYSASKGAVNSFTKALAKELAPSNIQVNAIACGAIDTDMNSHLSDEELSVLTEEIPAGRMGSPDDVASFVNNLINTTPYLTGQVITLDGGWI